MGAGKCHSYRLGLNQEPVRKSSVSLRMSPKSKENVSQSTIDSEMDTAVAVYPSHEEAEIVVKQLANSGFDMTKLSIIGKDYHTEEHVVGYYNTGDRMKAWGASGAFWGGLWGLMFGGAFLIPGVGPILMAGPLVAALVGMLEGAVVLGGLTALGAAFVSVGIPEDSAIAYESEVNGGKFVLIVHGTPKEIIRAKDILVLTNHIGISDHSSVISQLGLP